VTFLPIVERELRVAARKRSTFWLRVACAVVGLVIGSACMLLTRVRGLGTAQMGDVLFNVITWLSVAAVLCAGLFFTSDCLSEEKREGTLGFLFLTDLRGYDVVLGKLLATSLRAFYGLLAVFPILAVTLLLGGVTGAQFWKTSLALLNALVCSLAAGLAVSAMSRDSQKALGATLLVLLLFVGGGPLGDVIMGLVKGGHTKPLWSLSSPGYAFVSAGDWGRSLYWRGLMISQGVAWLLFVLACALVPRTWQEKHAKPASATKSWPYSWRYGGAKRRGSLRRKLLGRDPVLWLACRERWQSLLIWAMAILVAAGFIAVLISTLPREAWMVWGYVGGLFTLLLYLWAASQSCRFFLEARRSGMTELLLAAPLDEKQIVRGHWRALLRMFLVPVLILLSVHVAGSALSQISMRRMYAQIGASASGSTSTNSSGVVVYSTSVTSTNAARSSAMLNSGPATERLVTVLLAGLAAAASTAGNLVALCWFGMWMGMTSKSANLATLKTILFVQIIPALVIYVASAFLMMAVMMPYLWKLTQTKSPTASFPWMTWYPLLSVALGATLSLAKDIGFFVWSRKKLFSSFREEAARSLGQPRFAAPPILQPIAAPPVTTVQPYPLFPGTGKE